MKNPVCPTGAEVAATPLMLPRESQRCTGLAAPRWSASATSGLGALITVTADNTNAEKTLRALLSSAPDIASQLNMVLVTIDFRDKSGSDEAATSRKAWAEANEAHLRLMAQSLQQIGGNS